MSRGLDANSSKSESQLSEGGRIAKGGEFFRCEVGSGLHGLGLGGVDDRDEMGLCIEPAEYVIGTKHFEQFVFRTAEVREGKNAKSRGGDVDLVVYSLRKWMRLAMKGNPSILLMLFAPGQYWVISSRLARDLQALAPSIVSAQAGERFRGYLEAQKQRLLRERGTGHVPDRGDRDGKYASHMVRLGYQGVELMTTGRITLPMPEDERETCLAIKRGEADLDYALTLAGKMAKEIEDLSHDPIIPRDPDEDACNAFLLHAYNLWWRGTATDRNVRGMGKRVLYG